MKLLLLPALAGILACASFPKIGQSYIIWIAYVPLVVYMEKSPTSRRAFWGGLIAGLLQMGGLLVWIPAVLKEYGGIPWPGAWLLYLLLVGMQAVFPAAACAITRILIGFSGKKFLLLFPFVWVITEYLETRIPFGGFPWLLVGYSQTERVRLMQIADLTSVYGISFLVIAVNTSLAWLFLHKARSKGAFSPVGVVGLLVVVTLLYGQFQTARWEHFRADYTVAMLQQNISTREPEQEMERKFREGYLKMADKIGQSNVDLLILPESPSPVSFQYDESYRAGLGMLARRFPLGMVFNNIVFMEVEDGIRYFNSAYFLDGNGMERGRYDKIHLVPFGEYVPLKRLFFFIETISKDVSDFYPGTEFVTVAVGGHPTAAIICFEAVFPDIVRRLVSRGAELIINLTNDGWYGDTAAPHQHLAMARWRAVENRRYLLRATNSGISAVIDPAGQVQVRSGLLREDICAGQFGFVAARSFYSRHGDAFVFLCVIMIAGSFVPGCIGMVRGKIFRRDSKS